MNSELIGKCLCKHVTYEENGLTYRETTRQKYGNDGVISAGIVDGESGSEAATIYVRVEKGNACPVTLHLKPDEAQSVIWALSGVLWSNLARTIDT